MSFVLYPEYCEYQKIHVKILSHASPVVFVAVRNMKYRVGYSVFNCKFCSKWLKVDDFIIFLAKF